MGLINKKYHKMKNTMKYLCSTLAAVCMLAACSPEEFDDYDTGTVGTVTAEQVTFTMKTSPESDNILIFTNTTRLNFPYSFSWDLGNGNISKADSVTAIYPLAGSYTVSLSVSTADGTTVVKSSVIVIENDDPSLLDTPTYRDLTGGPNNADGKTWVSDRYNLYVDEIAAATEKNVKGHLGLGPQGSYGHDWWGASPDEKAAWKLYDFKFTFVQKGLSLKIENGGEGYGRKNCIGLAGFAATSTDGDDALFIYGGGDYTFTLKEPKDQAYGSLTLSENAFMGYYCGTQKYDILYLTDETMALRADNATDGRDLVFVYVREDLNVGEPH